MTKLRFMRWLARLALKRKLYYRWSRLYRFLWERGHKNKSIPSFVHIAGVQKTIREMQWKKDNWRMLWDAISYPHATWIRHLNNKGSDCDDISLFAAVAIEQLKNSGHLEAVRNVGLLSVPWMTGTGKVGGHNVALFSYEQDGVILWAHMSNWHGGSVKAGFHGVHDVVLDVLEGCRSLGWAWCTTDLRLVDWGEGKELDD